jgi:hypothetical protein
MSGVDCMVLVPIDKASDNIFFICKQLLLWMTFIWAGLYTYFWEYHLYRSHSYNEMTKITNSIQYHKSNRKYKSENGRTRTTEYIRGGMELLKIIFLFVIHSRFQKIKISLNHPNFVGIRNCLKILTNKDTNWF